MSNLYQFPTIFPSVFTDTVSLPAAGAQLSEVIPGQFRRHILKVEVILTTDANAANRFVSVSMAQSANVMYKSYAPIACVASTTYKFFFNIGQGSTEQIGALDNYNVPLNSLMILEPSWEFQINVDNIQVGDAITGVILTNGRWSRTGETA